MGWSHQWASLDIRAVSLEVSSLAHRMSRAARSALILLLLLSLEVASADRKVESKNNVIVILGYSALKFVNASVVLLRDVRSKGNYSGDIVLLCDDCSYSSRLAKTILSSTELERISFENVSRLIDISPPNRVCSDNKILNQKQYKKRTAQWKAYYAKIAIFSPYFKRWDRVLYFDSMMEIALPRLNHFFTKIDSTGSLMANIDGFPSMKWTLKTQFIEECDKKLFEKLSSTLDMTERCYFQSTVMLYDTSIMDEKTYETIIQMYQKWGPIADGDQAIFNIYFNNFSKLFKPLPYILDDGSIPYEYFRRIPKANYIVIAHRP